jgi:nucleotide-binding universal stress UspA family protein
MAKILVTTDLSNNSKSAIKFAFQLASQMPMEIIFFNVEVGVPDNEWYPKKGKNKDKSSYQIRLEKLKDFIQRIIRDQNLPFTKYSCEVEIGIDTKNIILDFAKKKKVDFICTSTRGAGIGKKLLGTNTSSLIQHSTIPVFVIPKAYRVKQISELWYSSDLANLGTELGIVKKFAQKVNSKIHVYNYDFLAELEEVQSKQNKIAIKYTNDQIKFHFRKQHIENTISQDLQEDIKKRKPSMIVLFTKIKKSWFERLFYRNNTAEVTFDTKVPLLIYRKTSK